MKNRKNKYIFIVLCGMFISQSDSKAMLINQQNIDIKKFQGTKNLQQTKQYCESKAKERIEDLSTFMAPNLVCKINEHIEKAKRFAEKNISTTAEEIQTKFQQMEDQSKELLKLEQEVKDEISKFAKKIKEVDKMTSQPKEQSLEYQKIMKELYEYKCEAYIKVKSNYPYVDEQNESKVKIKAEIQKACDMKQEIMKNKLLK